MNHTGGYGTGRPRQARTNGESAAEPVEIWVTRDMVPRRPAWGGAAIDDGHG
jgi:hypothetical protein